MTTRALHLLTKKRLRDDVRFRRVWRIVQRGLRKPRRAAQRLAAFHIDQFGRHAVKRNLVGERLVQPPAERSGVVQIRLQNAGILREYVLPVGHPVIGPRRILQQAVNGFGPARLRRFGQIGGNLGWRGNQPCQVKRNAAQEFQVCTQSRGSRFGFLQLLSDESVDVVVGRSARLHNGYCRARRGLQRSANFFVPRIPRRNDIYASLPPANQIVLPVALVRCGDIRFPIRISQGRRTIGAQQAIHLAGPREAHRKIAWAGIEPLAADDGDQCKAMFGSIHFHRRHRILVGILQRAYKRIAVVHGRGNRIVA